MKILPQSAESFKQSVYKAGLLFAHANEYVTTILPLFSNLKNNSPQSVLSLHFTLPCYSSDHLAKRLLINALAPYAVYSNLCYLPKGEQSKFFFHL